MRPNSLWTAGCCVNGTHAESIAVMGNNDPERGEAEARPMSVAHLEGILAPQVGQSANLFPGNPYCRTNYFGEEWDQLLRNIE